VLEDADELPVCGWETDINLIGFPFDWFAEMKPELLWPVFFLTRLKNTCR